MSRLLKKERFQRSALRESPPTLRPVFEDFHLLTTGGDFEYPLHQHTNYEVILVEDGPYRCALNDVEVQLARGGILVIKPGDRHQDHFRSGQRHYVLHFHLQPAFHGSLPPRLFREGVTPAEQTIDGNHAYNALLLHELQREAMAEANFAGTVQDALLEGLFWRIVRHLKPPALSPELRRLPRAEIERETLIAAFATRIEQDANIGEVARSLNLSSRQLAMRCRAVFDLPPARFLQELKIRRAEELLRYRRLRVQEVSNALGFSNPFHFSRVYKRLRGRSPRQSVGN